MKSILSKAAQACGEAILKQEMHRQLIVASQLGESEDCVQTFEGTLHPPLLLRVLPFVRLFAGQSQSYLLSITDRRLLILQLRYNSSILTTPQLKSILASIPLKQIASTEIYSGLLSSSLILRVQSGAVYAFSQIEDDQGTSFIQQLSAAINDHVATESGPSENPPKHDGAHADLPSQLGTQSRWGQKIAGFLLALFGGILLMATVEGLHNGEFLPCLVAVPLGIAALWQGIGRYWLQSRPLLRRGQITAFACSNQD